MSRFDEVVKEARESCVGESPELRREQYATGYLAEWVCNLERDIHELNENLAAERQRRTDSVKRMEDCLKGFNAPYKEGTVT